jgi:hypothetical protein
MFEAWNDEAEAEAYCMQQHSKNVDGDHHHRDEVQVPHWHHSSLHLHCDGDASCDATSSLSRACDGSQAAGGMTLQTT